MKLNKIIQLLVEGPREDYIIDKQGARLQQVASGDSQASKDITQLVDQLSAIDPTKNKQYLQWLAKQYINGLFKIEDAPRINGVLNNFNQLKPRLAKRDINQYTLHQLEEEIDNITSGGATDNTKGSAYTNVPDSKVLYHGPYGTLVVPKTEAASCELGRGTKWCTAAENNNMFSHYSQAGDLYIWIDRSGKKYQFQLLDTLPDMPDNLDAEFDLMKDDLLYYITFDSDEFFNVNAYESMKANGGNTTQMIKEFKDDRDVDVVGQELDRLLAIPPINKLLQAQLKSIIGHDVDWYTDKIRSMFERYKNELVTVIKAKLEMIGDPVQLDPWDASEIYDGLGEMVYSAIDSGLLTDRELISQVDAVLAQLQARSQQPDE